jgi:hypothetical protein
LNKELETFLKENEGEQEHEYSSSLSSFFDATRSFSRNGQFGAYASALNLFSLSLVISRKIRHVKLAVQERSFQTLQAHVFNNSESKIFVLPIGITMGQLCRVGKSSEKFVITSVSQMLS